VASPVARRSSTRIGNSTSAERRAGKEVEANYYRRRRLSSLPILNK
jgi:hypothetical protein